MFQQQKWRYLENTERQRKIGKDKTDDRYKDKEIDYRYIT